jgi:hypothetical protein
MLFVMNKIGNKRSESGMEEFYERLSIIGWLVLESRRKGNQLCRDFHKIKIKIEEKHDHEKDVVILTDNLIHHQNHINSNEYDSCYPPSNITFLCFSCFSQQFIKNKTE